MLAGYGYGPIAVTLPGSRGPPVTNGVALIPLNQHEIDFSKFNSDGSENPNGTVMSAALANLRPASVSSSTDYAALPAGAYYQVPGNPKLYRKKR
jgi:hypothetical protein